MGETNPDLHASILAVHHGDLSSVLPIGPAAFVGTDRSAARDRVLVQPGHFSGYRALRAVGLEGCLEDRTP